MKAFIFDPLWNDLITNDLKSKLDASGLEVIIATDVAPLMDHKELYEGDEDRLLCLNPDYVNWRLTSEDYRNIPNLKGIFGAATSTTWIEKSYANEHGIPVCDIKNFSTEAVAEWAITMMFNVARQVPGLIKDDFPLDFDKDYMRYRGIELHGKKAGIVGLGHIGSAIAARCAGLGMDVIYWSRSPKQVEYEKVELSQLFADADVIFPTMELNDETKTLLDDELLKSMKDTAMVIQTAHGLFSQQLVIDMVKNGKLYGYGLEAEPATFSSYEGNIWAAPAYAWATDSTMHNSMVKWIDNILSASEGRFPNRIN